MVLDLDTYSEQALEFFYIDDEIEEYLSDETESESVEAAVWFDLGFSCLYQVIYHLRGIRSDSEEISNKEKWTAIIEAYRELGKMTSVLLDDYEE